MSFESVKTAYNKYKHILMISVMMSVSDMIMFLESSVLKNVGLISSSPESGGVFEKIKYSCFRNRFKEVVKDTNTIFYWTESQQYAVSVMYFYSPIVTLLFGGIMSDKYGGQRVVLMAMTICTVVISTLYLSIFRENHIFIVMLTIRYTAASTIWVALFSLAGKLASTYQKTIILSVVLAAEGVGGFLGYIISAAVVDWASISHVSGFVSFVATIWWWLVCRQPAFPHVPQVIRIPWKDIITSASFYVSCLLVASTVTHDRLLHHVNKSYLERVIFFNGKPEWAIKLMYCVVGVIGYLFWGVSSDFITTKIYLSTCASMRYFVGLSIIILFCTLEVLHLAECNRVLVLACVFALRYSSAFEEACVIAVVTELSPSCFGSILGIAFMFGITTMGNVYDTLKTTFISSDSMGDISRWNLLFFTLAFFVLFLSLPFICLGIKKASFDSGVYHRKITRPVAAKDVSVNQRQFHIKKIEETD